MKSPLVLFFIVTGRTRSIRSSEGTFTNGSSVCRFLTLAVDVNDDDDGDDSITVYTDEFRSVDEE